MPEGSSVGAIYLDLVVRDTIARQVQALSDKAAQQARQSFSWMEKAAQQSVDRAAGRMNRTTQSTAESMGKIGTVWSRSAAMVQLRINELERSFDRLGEKLDAIWQSRGGQVDNIPAFDRLLEQQQKILDKIETQRQKLAIEVALEAQKQAAAEKKAYEQAARAAEQAARRQQQAARTAHAANAPNTRSINTENAVRLQPDSGWLTRISQELTGSYAGAAQEAQASADQAKSAWEVAISKIASGIRQGIGGAFSALKGIASKAAGGIGAIFSGLAKRMLPFQNGIQKAGSGVQSLGARLRSIVSGALVFNLLSSGLSKLTASMGQALFSSASLRTALGNLQGAAATAAAPLIQVLTPALTALANAAATVFSYISRLVSFFTGKSVAASAAAAAGMAGVGSAASGTAKKVKEATRTLAGFDEIERLGKPQEDEDAGGTGGGGGGGAAVLPNYDFQGKTPFLDSILEAIEAGNWYQVGALIGAKLRDSLNAIPWPQIQDKVQTWVQNLADTINGFIETPGLWEAVGHTFAQGLNTITLAVNTFADGVHWESLGAGLANGLSAAIREIRWEDLGSALTAGLRIALQTLHGFVTTFTEWQELGTSIATMLTSAFNSVDWVQAAADFGNLVIGLLTTLNATISSIDWSSVGQTVLAMLSAIDWAGIFESLFTLLGTLIGAGIQFLSQIILPTLQSFGSWIASHFTEIGTNGIQGFLDGMMSLLADIGGWLKAHMIDPLVNAVKNMLGIHSPSTVFSEIGINLVQGLFNGVSGVWHTITDFFGNALDGIKNKFSDAWNAVQQNTASVFEAVRGVMEGAWSGITETVRGAVNTVIGFMNRLLSGAASMVNGLIDILNGFSIEVPEDVPLIGGTDFGFNIAHVAAPQIPMLASGGVIRQPTLAMMGEYAGAGSNPEIVAPQDLLRQTVSEALDWQQDTLQAGFDALVELLKEILEAIYGIEISDEQIGRAMERYDSRRTRMTGGI